eukprot:4751963-Prymnesium_polylepis.1
MPHLQTLGLGFNQIGDVGHDALSAAVATGALASLRRVTLRSHSLASRKAELAINLRIQHLATQRVGFVPARKPPCRRASEALEDACSRLSGHATRHTQSGILAERLSALRESHQWRAIHNTATPTAI